jgi:hypothetical protein
MRSSSKSICSPVVASTVLIVITIAAAVTILIAKRWRFSLRALLFATTLVAVVLGLTVAAT